MWFGRNNEDAITGSHGRTHGSLVYAKADTAFAQKSTRRVMTWLRGCSLSSTTAKDRLSIIYSKMGALFCWLKASSALGHCYTCVCPKLYLDPSGFKIRLDKALSSLVWPHAWLFHLLLFLPTWIILMFCKPVNLLAFQFCSPVSPFGFK